LSNKELEIFVSQAEISNTQAILILRFEADSEESLKEIRKTVESKVNEITSYQ